MQIRIDDLAGRDVRALLEEHLNDMHAISPPESVHALDLDALRQPDVTFFTAWSEAALESQSALLGCGALKELDSTHGEIKSMRTTLWARGTGVGRAILLHILGEAHRRGYSRVSLETGSQPEFVPARRMYESVGFSYCGPFEGYIEDPHSVFMTLSLRGS